MICRYDEQLVQRAVLNCFPEWKALRFVDGRIVSIGERFQLVLDPPTDVRSRFSQVEMWMKELENTARLQMLLLFTSLMVESQEKQDWLLYDTYPEQLKVLILWLNLTENVEQGIR